MGFAGSLVMGSSNGFSANFKKEKNEYDSSNSPRQRHNETKFRSTFHNTVSGKFLDFPPLSEKQDNTSKDYNQSTRSSFNDFSNSLSRKRKQRTHTQTSTNFYTNRNKLPDVVTVRQSQERPQKRGRPNCIGLDLRPATPINVIKITSIGCEEDEITGKMKLTRKNKHSLSLSPIRNTLAKNKSKHKNQGLKSKISKYNSSHYDSTMESLNIEAYMRDNSTLAIEEVDEDDPEYSCVNVKALKSSDLKTNCDSSKQLHSNGSKVVISPF